MKVLRLLMDKGHFYHSTHIVGHADDTAFREGERHMVLWIMSMLTDEQQDQIRESVIERFFGEPLDTPG